MSNTPPPSGSDPPPRPATVVLWQDPPLGQGGSGARVGAVAVNAVEGRYEIVMPSGRLASDHFVMFDGQKRRLQATDDGRAVIVIPIVE